MARPSAEVSDWKWLGTGASTAGSAVEVRSGVGADAAVAASDALESALRAASDELEMGGKLSGGGFSAGTYLLLVWWAGTALLFCRFVLGLVSVAVMSSKSRPLRDEAAAELLRTLARRCGIGRRIRLVTSDFATMPMTWGVVRPAVLLPRDAATWTAERREAVLMHELAHVRRLDVLTQAVARVACAMFWFNPLVWLAASRMHAESERACDDWVLRAGTRASTYARELLDMAKSAATMGLPLAALPLARRRGFEGRLLAILDPEVDRREPGRRFAVAGGILVVALSVVVAAMGNARPAAAGTPELFASPIGSDAEELAEALADGISGSIDEALAEGIESGVEGSLGVANAEMSAAVRALTQALADSDGGVRVAAAQALGEQQDPRSVAALSNALRNDPDVDVRETAARSLGQLENPAGLPALTAALRGDTAVQVRRAAAWAMGQIEDPAAVEGLTAALRDADAEVKRTAVWALGQIESANAVESLVPLLRDGDVEVRKQAAWALGQIESAQAVEGLSAVLRNDTDVEVRKQAAWALGQIEDAAAMPALSAALRDADNEVRSTAIWAIGQIEPDTAPPALIEALRDSNPAVRQAAAHAAGQIGDRTAVAALTPLLQDSVLDVRRAALAALMSVGDVSAVDALVQLLQDPDPEIRKAAASALGRIR
jgi:HEAT repeat protein/beta-lactamase regulating signal transducer with metallopeptidase domain